ncbi:MAG: hypothetical protein FWD87_03680 [Spirochaetaceae bacterium]|nr:hypothetical protein [Spirochaetaceae bacterium]
MYRIFILLLFLAGCDILKQYELEVIMPHLPGHIKSSYSDIRFELKYPGATPILDNYKEIRAGSSVFISSSFSTGLSVFPVVAIPYMYLDTEKNSKEHITFYPAGGIFPESGKDGKLFLTWEDGFVAEIIYKMVGNGYNLESFNIGRLKNYVIDRSSGNPWIYNEENIIYALSFGIFNANFVRRLESHQIVLQIPYEVSGKKGWVLSNLSDSRIFEENNGVLILDDIPKRNVFIFSDTGKEFAELFLDGSGWHAYFSNSKGILSGRW